MKKILGLLKENSINLLFMVIILITIIIGGMTAVKIFATVIGCGIVAGFGLQLWMNNKK